MGPTRRGVYHNLQESEYTVSNGEAVLFFSSKFYMHKFLSEYREYRLYFHSKTDLVLQENILNMDLLADFSLYRKIEKRGFLATVKGDKQTWRSLHRYALAKMTDKNTPDWFVTHGQKLDEPKGTTE